MQKCRSSFSSSGVAINRKVNTKCNHSPLIVQYLLVSKNFYPCCTAAIYNISLMFMPCKSLGYFPWTWMCFWPGSLDLLGWARLQTSSFPFLLSWIAFPYWCLNGSQCLQTIFIRSNWCSRLESQGKMPYCCAIEEQIEKFFFFMFAFWVWERLSWGCFCDAVSIFLGNRAPLMF